MTHARRRSFLRTVTGLGVVGLAGCSLGGGPSIDTHLTGWEGGFSSEFGSAASLSDDTCVVGAPGARDGDERVELGAAYVFERSEGTWNQ